MHRKQYQPTSEGPSLISYSARHLSNKTSSVPVSQQQTSCVLCKNKVCNRNKWTKLHQPHENSYSISWVLSLLIHIVVMNSRLFVQRRGTAVFVTVCVLLWVVKVQVLWIVIFCYVADYIYQTVDYRCLKLLLWQWNFLQLMLRPYGLL